MKDLAMSKWLSTGDRFKYMIKRIEDAEELLTAIRYICLVDGFIDTEEIKKFLEDNNENS